MNLSCDTSFDIWGKRRDPENWNPPAHAMISLELTMFFIGGDLSGVGHAIKGGRQVLMRQGGKEAWPLVAGVVKKKGRKGGPVPNGGNARRHGGNAQMARLIRVSRLCNEIHRYAIFARTKHRSTRVETRSATMVPKNSIRHGDTIRGNDSLTQIELHVIPK